MYHSLTAEDYRSLKRTVRGWTARRLADHGIAWPPQHGWRQKLLREYESGVREQQVETAHPQVMDQPKQPSLMFDFDRAYRKEMKTHERRVQRAIKQAGASPDDPEARLYFVDEDIARTKEMLEMRRLYREKSGEK
jgi:hypothetical protein